MEARRTAHVLEDEIAIHIGVLEAATMLGSPFNLRQINGRDEEKKNKGRK